MEKKPRRPSDKWIRRHIEFINDGRAALLRQGQTAHFIHIYTPSVAREVATKLVEWADWRECHAKEKR